MAVLYGHAVPARRVDRILSSKVFGLPILLLLFGFLFWLTAAGANYPSQLLMQLFTYLEGELSALLTSLGAPEALRALLAEGAFRTTGWVVAVMLPPMAIFFPLFTLLEDVGFLPRLAFNVDRCFRPRTCAWCAERIDVWASVVPYLLFCEPEWFADCAYAAA